MIPKLTILATFALVLRQASARSLPSTSAAVGRMDVLARLGTAFSQLRLARRTCAKSAARTCE